MFNLSSSPLKTIELNQQQLDYIQAALKSYTPPVPIFDEYQTEMGPLLIDMVDMVLKDTDSTITHCFTK